jgi:hypothetical protein
LFPHIAHNFSSDLALDVWQCALAHVVRCTAASPLPKGRRGRLSHDDYAKAVAAVLRADLLQLEECALLAQLPGVRALAKTLTRTVFPTSLAIRVLLDRAVGEVELLTLNQRDPASRRIG